jgi:phosphoribosylaminoimidazolecarboxamide formyltransferase/IMP cyclohydrolase
MQLRYGMNPHQSASWSPVGERAPFAVVSGSPSYINVLDALGGWQLVREAAAAFGLPAAASFKHVSPAGAAIAGPVDEAMRSTFGVDDVGAVTSAYVRARDADPKSSYGDFVAVSHPVDAELAGLLKRLVCDGIIAPGYDEGVVGALAAKKRGSFLVLEADAGYEPPATEVREVYGVRLTQERDAAPLDLSGDLLLGSIVARYTQSNTVALVKDGMAIGIGAGQQSRVDCTRLAGEKASLWWSRRSSDPLTGVSMVSDGALPFADNVDEAARHGVQHIAEPGGSIRSPEVQAACDARGITLAQTGIRLFRH